MEAAKKARTLARIQCTKQSNIVLGIFDGDAVTKGQYRLEVDRFHERVKAVQEAQQNIFKLLDEEELEAENEEADKYDAKHIKNVLLLINERREDEHVSCQKNSIVSPITAKLPKLQLKGFSGDVQEWLPFWEQFQHNVDQRKDLADSTKFSYLRSVLSGDAERAIAGLSLTGASYRTAIDILQDRFGRESKIIFTHVQALLGVAVPDRPSVEALWRVYGDLQQHIRSLDNMAITGDQYGVILTPLILSRLPASLRLEWAREGERAAAAESARAVKAEPGSSTTPKVSWEADLAFLMDFLRREIQRRETSQTYVTPEGGPSTTTSTASAASLHSASQSSTRSSGSSRAQRSGSPRAKRPGSTRGHTSSGSTSKTPKCGICGESKNNKHSTDKCPVLKALSTHDDIFKLVCEHTVCMKCLKKLTPDNPHKFRDCQGKCAQCSGPHHTSLHRNNHSSVSHTSYTSSTCTSLSTHSVLLQTLKVSVGGQGGKKKALILFDTGADRSYVSQELVDRIKPEFVEQTVLSCASFGAKKPSKAEKRAVYNLTVEGDGNGIAINATCVPTICAPLMQPSVPANLLEKIPQPNFVSVPAGHDLKVDVLVGMDAYWKFFTADTCRVSEKLVANRTHFGWVMSGQLPAVDPTAQTLPKATVAHQLFVQGKEPVEALWELEAIGITERQAENQVWSDFEASIERVEGRYSVGLPWRDGMAERLKSNRASAQKRLANLNLRLERDDKLRDSYHDFFQLMEDQGIVEEVPEEEIETTRPVYYLPHHPVVKETSVSTKVRPVFDASAKAYNGLSLNDCMHTGPNLLPDLVALLLRFRRWKVALTADVVKAFLQVAVHPADRDAHRFLWNDRVMRFKRVPFGNCASPFLLCATIRHHLSTMPQSLVVTELTDNLYMDDWMTGCDDEAVAKQMFHDAEKIMLEAGMTLAKWTSNSLNFAEKVAETTKVLGMKWTPESDVFSFDGVEVPPSLCLTKRTLLSLISRLFDPLGLLNPFTIRAKILFQSLWKEEYGWDQTLSDEWSTWLGGWLEELEVLKCWTIPRRFFSILWSEKPTVVLHGFGDASPQAYGACVYIVTGSDGDFQSSLVMSRARVAPIKSISLPRLELLGALLCARLMDFVRTALKLDADVKSFYWTDSTVALAWIHGEPHKWKTFVANRVTEIQNLSKATQWGHCPGKINPADLLTRGVSGEELVSSEFWLHGPTELLQTSNIEPLLGVPSCNPDEDVIIEEERRPRSDVVALTVEPVKPFFDIRRHSKLTKALRVMGYVLRFIRNIKGEKLTGDLSFKEISEAKLHYYFVQVVSD